MSSKSPSRWCGLPIAALVAFNSIASVAWAAGPRSSTVSTSSVASAESKKKSIEKQRSAFRKKLIGAGRVRPGFNDQAQYLVEGDVIESIAELDKFREISLEGEKAPWSDTYWPLYAGQLANRFMDDSFGREVNWKKNFDVNATKNVPIENLSPSEKYDLLMGLNPNSPNSLTYQAWESARSQADENGNVESWMGICHGWAPAAMMEDRALTKVVAKGLNGEEIPFYADDIKGLASLLWATGRYNNKFLGGRCNLKSSDLYSMGAAARDAHPECWDTNAGTWHKVVVNQLKKGRSFVIDAIWDYQVWNQPVLGFKYSYFNPRTRLYSDTLEGAAIDYASFESEDPFLAFRKKGSYGISKLVGVEMRLTYVSENSPTSFNYPDNPDESQAMTYRYDLEIDSQGNVVGGEWYSESSHPDFLWTPSWEQNGESKRAEVYQSVSVADENWDPTQSPAPADWRREAESYAGSDQPLSHVVKKLIEASRKR